MSNWGKSGFFKNVVTSLLIILITAAASVIYGFIVRRVFTLAYVFNACFLAGAIIICSAIVMMILPARLKFGKLVDHTTYAERYAEQRKQKQEKAYGLLFLGILVIVFTGLIQFALAVLIPAVY